LATASPLDFDALGVSAQVGQASGFLAEPLQIDLYRVSVDRGEQLRAALNAQSQGSVLEGVLRIFDAGGKQVALNNQEGGDPQLTFQAATTGVYYVGISSAGNAVYNP